MSLKLKLGRLPGWSRPILTVAALAVGAWLILWSCTSPSGLQPPPRPSGQPPVPSRGRGLSLKDLSRTATAQGQLTVAWSRPPSAKWQRRFQDAFDREFEVNVSLTIVPGPTPSALAGARPPAWDLLIGDDAQYAQLARSGLLGAYDWSGLFGAPAKAARFQHGALAFTQEIDAPAYSTGLAGARKTALSSWQALLDPRWKGRIGVLDSGLAWAGLSSVWGDSKTVAFLKGLAKQKAVLGSGPRLEGLLERGTIQAIAVAPDWLVAGAAQANRPVTSASVQPLLLRSVLAGPVKTAAHPSAALLFAGFLTTEEGQRLWQRYSGESSIYVAGSAYQRLIAGKRIVFLDQAALPSDVAARATTYARLLGA